MFIEGGQQALSYSDFIDLAKCVGGEIPSSFIEHYKCSNGGYPEENYVLGKSNEFTFQGFFPIKYGGQTIESMWSDISEWRVLGKFIPFGFDDGGNIFYISLDLAVDGKVYLLTADSHDVFEVCDSFESFLKALQFKDY